jgi:hypothetical protein
VSPIHDVSDTTLKKDNVPVQVKVVNNKNKTIMDIIKQIEIPMQLNIHASTKVSF